MAPGWRRVLPGRTVHRRCRGPSHCAGHKRLSAKPVAVPSNILFHWRNMDKIVSKLYFLFDSIKRFLPEQKARWVEEYLEANERGLVLESILEYQREFDISR
jgi:hypothetical protein